jgi:hypothetical protein
MTILNIVLLVSVAGLAGYLFWFVGRHRKTVAMFQSIIDAHRTPVLFYDRSGRLVYSDAQAETVFEQIPGDIKSFAFIEQSSTPDGPDLYLTDRFGNGYRLEVTDNALSGQRRGKVVFVKGYAQVRTNPR